MAADSAPAQRLLIVTRPRVQADGWVQALQALGHSALALPLIGIAPVADTRPVMAAWQRLREFALVMFVSANAVQQFFALRPGTCAWQGAWPAGLRAGATGPGTAAALLQAGVAPGDVVQPAADAAVWDSEALWAQLAQHHWAGRQVLVVRGEDGRDWLADVLAERGAQVAFVAAYRRHLPSLTDAEHGLLQRAQLNPAGHLWLFSSSQAVAHLQALAPQADWRRGLAFASHPRIAQAARDAGFAQVGLVGPAVDSVASLLLGLEQGLGLGPGQDPTAGMPSIQSGAP
jgi:uroporphyrinogen-III synthase